MFYTLLILLLINIYYILMYVLRFVTGLLVEHNFNTFWKDIINKVVYNLHEQCHVGI